MPYNMYVTTERLKRLGGEKTLSPRYFLLGEHGAIAPLAPRIDATDDNDGWC